MESKNGGGTGYKDLRMYYVHGVRVCSQQGAKEGQLIDRTPREACMHVRVRRAGPRGLTFVCTIDRVLVVRYTIRVCIDI